MPPQAVKNYPADSERPVSLVELLRIRAERDPHKLAYSFLADGEGLAERFSFGELGRKAGAIAAYLQVHGLGGKRAVLLYAPGMDFICAFFACLYAGVVAVPAYPPRNPKHVPRLQAIIADCGASAVLTESRLQQALAGLLGAEPTGLAMLVTDSTEVSCFGDFVPVPDVSPDDLAFLQYTSGSTGHAKGVMVSHANLMANQTIIMNKFGHDESSTVVGWLPLYHDMGLIGNVLQPLFIGSPAILMPPMAFIEKPLRWLKAISDYQAHTSGGPNFAFDLCVKRIAPEDKRQLDLSSWKLAFNGAEPVQAATLKRFAEAFAECGFRPEAFYPCYGLAEATLIATGVDKACTPVTQAFDRQKLEEGVAEAIRGDGGKALVSCGRTGNGHELRIVNPDSLLLCRAGQIGEIQLSGASITQGYWQNREATETSYIADVGKIWLRTGDLGFLHNGELFVAGRLKDLIIVRGRNFYPHDIESAVEAASDSFNFGGVAAVSVVQGEAEALVVLAELKRQQLKKKDFSSEFGAVRQQLVEQCGIEADRIALLKPGALFKTSSGKIRRKDCKKAYEEGRLDIVATDSLSEQHSAVGGASVSGDSVLWLSKAALLHLPEAECLALLSGYLSQKIQALSGLQAGLTDTQASLLSLGLDSLKVMEVKYFIDDLLAVNFPVSYLLAEGHGIAGIAKQALALAVSTQDKYDTDVDDGYVDKHSASYGQRSVWIVCKLEGDSSVYNLAIALQIKSALSIDALEAALNLLVARHPQLRTGFRWDDGALVQIALPVSGHPPLLKTLVTGETGEAQIQQAMAREAQRPFDLENAIKLRAVLFSAGEENHRLLLCSHHIAVDFRSLAILLEELKYGYAAITRNATVQWPELDTSYAGFIAWQQNYLASPAAESTLVYWQNRLSGELPKLRLPYDRQPHGGSSYHGGNETLSLDADSLGKLRGLAKHNGVTLNVLLLTAFFTLLYRYTGQQDIIIGMPVTGRPQKRFSGVVGYFVNPVAVRAFPGGAKSFAEFLAEVSQTVLAALQHQDYPASLLAEKLRPERGDGISPFYNVCFSMQGDIAGAGYAALAVLGMPDADMEWPGLRVSSMRQMDISVQFDLTLMMAVTGGELSVALQYRKDLFDHQTIQRMAGHLTNLLNAIWADPGQPLAFLPLLSPAERHRQIQEWNATQTAFPQDCCIHQLFERQAEQTPEATAVIFEATALSYAGLNERANRLAHRLIARGVKPDDRVAVCCERSLDLAIGLLAVLKAGAAYVPVDPDYPTERQHRILADCRPAVLLIQRVFQRRLSGRKLNLPVIVLDAEEKRVIASYSSANPDSSGLGLTSRHLAYIIYTSGSTGQPKGVMNQHQGVVNRLLWAQRQYRLTTSDRILQKTPYSFDVSVWELFLPLITGAQLVIAKPQGHQDAQYLINTIEAQTITTVHFVPSMLQAFLQQLDLQRCRSLRRVICSGEALPLALVQRFQQVMPAVELHNLYGPTEAAIDVTSHVCDAGTASACVPIGRPIDNTQIYVLDAYLNPVPVGVSGELYIGGTGLARGYFNRPDLTAERFIADPFSNQPGARLYRTGDVVRLLADGEIDYLDRIDHQVKIRGFRIELGEIEARLLQHPGIQQAAVLVKQNPVGEKFLAAYLCGQEPAPDVTAVKAFLRQALPEYMVPAVFAVLAALPLTGNGKLDRKALQGLGQDLNTRRDYVAPRDEVEQIIADIWQQILGVDRLGIHDDFFDLGGHSLAAVQIATRIKQDFAVEIPVKTLFEAPTIAEFVERLLAYQSD